MGYQNCAIAVHRADRCAGGIAVAHASVVINGEVDADLTLAKGSAGW
jgi:hypothetical protein